MNFQPLVETERRRLQAALRRNGEEGRAIYMDRRDTSFVDSADEVTDDEVVMAIRSVPCHY